MRRAIAGLLWGCVLGACPSFVAEDCDREPNPNLSLSPVELSGAATGFSAHDRLVAIISTDAGLAIEVPSKQWLLPFERGQNLIGFWDAAGGVVLSDRTHLYLASPEGSKQIVEIPGGSAWAAFGQAGLYALEGAPTSRVAVHLITPSLQHQILERSVDLDPQIIFPSAAGYCVQEYLRSRDGGAGTSQIRCNGTPVVQGPRDRTWVRASNRHVLFRAENGHTAVRIADKLELAVDIPPPASFFLRPSDSCGFLFAENDGGTGRIRYWSSQTESLILDHQLPVTVEAVSAQSSNGIYVQSRTQVFFLDAWRQQ